MKTLPILIIVLALFSCKSTKNAKSVKIDNGKIEAVVSTDKEMMGMDPVPFEVKKHYIEGNTLFMTVEYSGGCQDHFFDMIGSPMVAKSMPPIRSVKINHNSNGDACRGIVTKDLQFDIKALAYQQKAGDEIYLQIEGIEEKILYKYVAE